MLPAELQALQNLLSECTALAKDMRQSVVVSGQTIAAAEGKVFQLIAEHGPTSVPQLGRLRNTSRQNAQVIVNKFLENGWVEVVDNPAHKRSPLVRLTQSGTAFPAKIRAAETDVMERLAGAFLIEDVKASTTLLAGIRKRLQKPHSAAAPGTRDREPAKTPGPVDEEIPVSLL